MFACVWLPSPQNSTKITKQIHVCQLGFYLVCLLTEYAHRLHQERKGRRGVYLLPPSLTTVKVPLSKVLSPPLLQCICSVVNSTRLWLYWADPRCRCLCMNDCNEQQQYKSLQVYEAYMLECSCLFTHSAETGQHYHSLVLCLCPLDGWKSNIRSLLALFLVSDSNSSGKYLQLLNASWKTIFPPWL